MPERPLLLFPTPETASKSKLGGGGGDFRKPTPSRQWERLSPQFKVLREVFDARRAEIQQSTAGIDPEQVLVIETIGSVDEFANAVKKIRGLEWMGGMEIDEITPDEDFYNEKRPGEELSGRLYLLLTNQQALNEMLSLWERYQADPGMEFKRGLTKFRDVFLQLKSIRRWDVEDRLLETGILDSWRENLKYEGDRSIPFEAELWFRGSHQLRTAKANEVAALVRQAGGRILGQSVIEGIAYHSLLAELPTHAIGSIIKDPATELVKCEDIMFFRPVGQMVAGEKPPEGDVEMAAMEEMPLPLGEPVIALFDGLPLTNHQLLAGRLVIDDPDDWASDYAATERVHGTAMASLIVHGDLNWPASPLSRPVYVRPIMKPDPKDFQSPKREHVPDNLLFVDLLHRCIRRLFGGDGDEGPVAPNIKVINLSIGDPTRQFIHSMSPVARLLDWLSVKYGVLFVVSAGNHADPISLGISRNEFEALEPGERGTKIVEALYRDARHRKLLSPAETLNGLTVGAAHEDASQAPYLGGRFDPFPEPMPSPVSALGSGYRRAIKPDIVFTGGKALFEENLGSSRKDNFVIRPIQPTIRTMPPGNKTAIPGKSPVGNPDSASYSFGTSNATALISRAAGICHETLRQVFDEQGVEVDSRIHEAALLKAMLVHGCSWDQIGEHLKSQIEHSALGEEIRTRAESLYSRQANISGEINRQNKALLSRWMGYGIPKIDRVLDCTEQRATLLGFGELSDGEAHIFRLPLPPSLGSVREWRRLTVTLAWLSPISPNTQKYRTAMLWFGVDNKGLVTERSDADWQAVRRGTVQHEVFEGRKAAPFTDGDAIEIKVNCRKDAGKIQSPIAYGLVVSLEVAEGVDIAVYDEIQTRIAQAIRLRPMP
uniref:Subtilase family protein n=1 Tax=Candidatus Kentrum sp. LPFa TaxID=2126335 RepID=A0A450WP13_9GAMM|nr:MAG: Subtilase family protein [Candidatus Kentron sp. LPFa]VFK33264.1 MAG: Subtilase family protein [Candidatus Kentron sp. LPFa]